MVEGARTEEPLPDFLVIGAQRCGTGWVLKSLREHPQVSMPDGEIHFFDQNWSRGLGWYARQFEDRPADVRIGEKTPEYVLHLKALERIKKTVPDADLVAILRDPVDRAYSEYWRQKDRYGPSFSQAVREHPELLERGHYQEQLENVLSLFPSEQVHVGIFDDLREDDEKFLEEIYCFLGIDAGFRPSWLGKTYNATVFPRFQRTLERLRLDPLIDVAKKIGLDQPVRRLHRKIEAGSYPPMEEEIRAQLDAYYASRNTGLEDMLGREIDWA